MTVDGNAKAFFLEHQLMRICFGLRRLAHGAAPEAVPFAPLCVGLARANQFRVPGAALGAGGWYALDAALLDGDAEIARATVVFEARADAAEAYAVPPGFSGRVAETAAPIELSVDGATVAVDCAGLDLFDCVRDFCAAHRVEPALQCMAALAASFEAAALDAAAAGGPRGDL